MRMNPWLLGGGTLVALLLIGRKASAALMPTSSRERDLDALADMLITETRFAAAKAEMAQIVYIAINRARSQNRPIWQIVAPGKSGANPTWNEGAPYEMMYENARNNARWPEARAFVESVLNGTSGFANMGAKNFVHPGSANFDMPCRDIPQVRDGRWSPANVPGYGTRCIPKWAQGGKIVGKGLFT